MLKAAPPVNHTTHPPLAASPSTPGSDTSYTPAPEAITKAWELPPRPKPGRKPAEDTPPTKRKAQNRAAQRAFRERRAARVGELEEEKKLIKDQHESREDQWKRERDQERQIYQQTVTEWRVRSEHWERLAGDETRRRIEEERLRLDERRLRMDDDRRHQDEMQSLRRELEVLRMSASWNAQSGPFNMMTPTPKDYPILPLPTPTQLDSIGCRDCGTNGRCACIEQVLNTLPEPAVPNDRVASNEHAMEIDFTAKFAKKPVATMDTAMTMDDLPMSMGTPISPAEHCGFCTDDANCVCKASMLAAGGNNPSSLASPPESISGERSTYVASKPQPIEPSPFAKGPGSCPACQTDPERRRFCQTLAGLMPPPPLPRQNSTNLQPRSSEVSGQADGRISCADAYTALSKDPEFERKRESISFMQQLKTQPAQKEKDCNTCESKGCSSYEVDCASVLAAMKGSGARVGAAKRWH